MQVAPCIRGRPIFSLTITSESHNKPVLLDFGEKRDLSKMTAPQNEGGSRKIAETLNKSRPEKLRLVPLTITRIPLH
jgi:hypothetical protein